MLRALGTDRFTVLSKWADFYKLRIVITKKTIRHNLFKSPSLLIFMNKLKFLAPKHKKKLEKLMKDINDSIDLLYELATIDEKTGLYNNKFFNSIFDIEFEKAKRGVKLSLAIIDIDFFKKINDTYGHMKADKLLLELANLLKKNLRKSDIIARFGGEEIFVLMPGTILEKSKFVMERIRQKVLSNSILKKHNLTVSIGISQYRKKDTKMKLKERADQTLYKAKNEGRNRVCCS